MDIGKFKVAISPFIENKNLGKEITKDINPEGVGSNIGSKLGGGIKTGLKVGAAGLAVAGGAIASLGGAAIKAQAEIQQSLGGAEAVFEANSGTVKNWAASAAGSMGISTNAALETANKMGSLFQGAGISAKESSEMTMNMSKRAADVASVMGVDLSSAMEAVTGAAKGNFTMMDNLGVAMNNSTLEAYAQAKGLDKTFASMENGEKIGLAYQLFMEKTGKYAGNFEKENKTLAGSFDVMSSSWQNVLYSMGDPEMLKSAIGQFTTSVGNMAGAILEILPVIVESIGTLFTDLMPVLLETINKLIPALVDMLATSLPPLIQSIVDILPTLITTLMEALTKLLPVVLDAIIILVEGIMAALPTLIIALDKFLIDAIPTILNAAIKLLTAIIDAIPVIYPKLIEAMPMMIDAIMNMLIKATPEILKSTVMMLGGLLAAIPVVLESLVKALPTIGNAITDSLVKAMPGIRADAGKMFWQISQALANWWNGFVGKIGSWFGSIGTKIGNAVGNLNSVGKDIVNGIWDGIKTRMSWLFTKLKSFANQVTNNIKEFFGIHSPSVIMRKEVGSMIGAGVGLGIKDSTNGVINKANNFSSNVSDAIMVGSGFDYGFNGDISGNGAGSEKVVVNNYVDQPKDMMDLYLITKRAAIQGSGS